MLGNGQRHLNRFTAELTGVRIMSPGEQKRSNNGNLHIIAQCNQELTNRTPYV